MNDFDRKFLNCLNAELDAATEKDCAIRIQKLIEHLGKLARKRWLELGNGKLWEYSQPVWWDVLESLTRLARKDDVSESTEMWVEVIDPTIGNIEFLASRVLEKRSPKLQATARTALAWLLQELSKDENHQAHQIIRLIGELWPPYFGEKESLVTPVEMYDVPLDSTRLMADADQPPRASRLKS